jgi:glycosyltransferase involved in cell wall biosynthesis
LNILSEKIKLVNVGLSGFPFGSAAINRCLNLYEILPKEDFEVLLINNKAIHHNNLPVNIEKEGKYSHLYYEYTTPLPYKSNSFMKRRISNFLGILNEFKLLFKLGVRKEIDIMFYYPQGKISDLLFYRFFSKLFGFPLVSHYVEYRSSFEKNNFFLRIRDRIFDSFFMFFIDGFVPISQYLEESVKEKKSQLLSIKIPPLFDFNKFDFKQNIEKKSYFLYVGYAGYIKPILKILDSFEIINDNSYYLYLILHGNLDEVENRIKKHPKKDLIKLNTKLEYEALIQYMFDAKALLIPLEDSIKDIARFPNKISEYLATKRPIITTNYGEIKYYFKDQENALIADSDEPEEFSSKMEFVISNPQKSEEIGANGNKIGLKYFNNINYREPLITFISKLINK